MSEGMDETYRNEDDLEFEVWVRQTSATLAQETEDYLEMVEESIISTTKMTYTQIQSFLSDDDENTERMPSTQNRKHAFMPRVKSMLSILGMLLIQS